MVQLKFNFISTKVIQPQLRTSQHFIWCEWLWVPVPPLTKSNWPLSKRYSGCVGFRITDSSNAIKQNQRYDELQPKGLCLQSTDVAKQQHPPVTCSRRPTYIGVVYSFFEQGERQIRLHVGCTNPHWTSTIFCTVPSGLDLDEWHTTTKSEITGSTVN